MKNNQVKPEENPKQDINKINVKSKKIKKSPTKGPNGGPRYEEYILEDEATDALNKLQDDMGKHQQKIQCLQDENNNLKLAISGLKNAFNYEKNLIESKISQQSYAIVQLESLLKAISLETHQLREYLNLSGQYQNGYNQNFMQCNQSGFQERSQEQQIIKNDLQYQQDLQTMDDLLQQDNIISSQLNEDPTGKIEDCNDNSWQGFYRNSESQKTGIGSQK